MFNRCFPGFFIFLMIVSVLNENVAQVNPDSKDILFYQIMNARGTGESDLYIGSQYLYDQWYPAELILKNGNKVFLSNVKLNLYSSRVEVFMLGEEKELLPDFLDEVHLNIGDTKKSFLSNRATDFKELNDPGFYEFVSVGPVKIIARHSTYIQKPDPQAKILGLETKHRIVKRQSNFILYDNKLTEIKSIKDIKKNFRIEEDKIDKIAKEIKFDAKDFNKIVQIIEKISVPD